MKSRVKSSKEKLIWVVASASVILIFLSAIVYSTISASNLTAQLTSTQQEIDSLQNDVEKVESIQESIGFCRDALGIAEDAYDSYWSAYLGWTDEFQVMLDYGIFAADTVALIAIPQIAADGDDALYSAQNLMCG